MPAGRNNCSRHWLLGMRSEIETAKEKTMVMRWLGLVALGAILGGGCSNDTANPFDLQVERGATAYAANCARCHGAGGEGTDIAPRVVGLDQGALPLDPPADRNVRAEQFVTAGDVATFAAANMPADDPGSLTLETYLDILAFALSANGITLEEELTVDVANGLTIPR